jgi:Flp pilus assembly protein TadD
MSGGVEQAKNNISDRTSSAVSRFTTYFVERIDPESARSFEEYNIALESTRQKIARLKDINADLQKKPDDRKLLRLRAAIYASLGQYPLAAADIEHLLVRAPKSIKLLEKYADYLESMNSYDLALAQYTELAKLQPAVSNPLLKRAQLHFKLGHSKAARAALEAAIKLDDDDDARQEAQVELARELYTLGNAQEKSQQDRQNSTTAKKQAIALLTEVHSDYQASLSKNPDDPPYFNMAQSDALTSLADMQVLEKQYDQALKTLKLLDQEEKKSEYLADAIATKKIAAVLCLKGEKDEAARILKEARENAPKKEEPRKNVEDGLVRMMTGLGRPAARSLDSNASPETRRKEIATMLKGTNEASLPEYDLNTLIDHYDALGEKVNADRCRALYFEKLQDDIRLCPQRSSPYHDMGLRQEQDDKPEEALTWFEKGSLASPYNDDLYRHRIETLSGLGRYEQALALCQKANSQFKEISLLVAQARCQAAMGDSKGAAASIDKALLQSFDDGGVYRVRAELRRKAKDLAGAALDDRLATYFGDSSD